LAPGACCPTCRRTSIPVAYAQLDVEQNDIGRLGGQCSDGFLCRFEFTDDPILLEFRRGFRAGAS
jgi:hypothetical protein